MNINWKLVFDKIGTVVVDRRFWVALFVIGFSLFGTPEMVDNADNLGDEAAELAVVIIQVVGMLLGSLGLMASWTKRPPSGLQYKDAISEIDVFIEKLSAAVEKKNS